MLTRRRFVQGALAAASLPAVAGGRAGTDLRVALVGLGGRGLELLALLRARAGVRVVVLCDVDEQALTQARAAAGRAEVDVDVDYRHVLEREDVDAVLLSTPDHWHALQTLWALQAGKDVYVEAPLTLTEDEGRRVLAAARSARRVVGSGRAGPNPVALSWLGEGHLGAVRLVRAVVYSPQPSLGKTDKNQRIPDAIDYDLWCGPATLAPLRRARLHHDWRYRWDTGSGELGSAGIEMLAAALHLAGAEAAPPSVLALGARLGYADDGETPNCQLVHFGYASVPIVCELRGLPRDRAAQDGDWSTAMDDCLGVRRGVVVEAEGGVLRLDAEGARAVDAQGNELWNMVVERMPGPRADLEGWLADVEARRVDEALVRLERARLAALLVQRAGVAQRLAAAREPDPLREGLQTCAPLCEAAERLLLHLAANEVDTKATPLRLSTRLEYDSAETCTNDPVAARLATRVYREPYVLP